MRLHLLISAGLLLLIALGHRLAKQNSLYSLYEQTDIVLHILAGIMFGFIWIALTQKYKHSWKTRTVSALAFATFGSFWWEIWEFQAWQLVPQMMVYVPELSDTLGDIGCGMLGGALASLFSARIKA